MTRFQAFCVAMLIALLGAAIADSRGECAACALTPCGSSADCWSGCFCAKKIAEPIGTCFSQ